jgi:hypothetical protein
MPYILPEFESMFFLAVVGPFTECISALQQISAHCKFVIRFSRGIVEYLIMSVKDRSIKQLLIYHVQRVSAKHGVKDDFAFLWEHAIFRHPPNKNPLTDRSEILHS